MFQLGNLVKNKSLVTSSKSVIPAVISQSGFGGGHHGVAEKRIQGRIKVTDHIVWINLIPLDGVPRRIAAFSGESLLDAIQRYQVPGIYPDCKGGDTEFKPYHVPVDFYSTGVVCAGCQVIVADPWFDKCNKVPSFESQRLTRSDTPQAQNTRLACCIQVRPELNEMICVVGNNKTGSGDFFSGTDPNAF